MERDPTNHHVIQLMGDALRKLSMVAEAASLSAEVDNIKVTVLFSQGRAEELSVLAYTVYRTADHTGGQANPCVSKQSDTNTSGTVSFWIIYFYDAFDIFPIGNLKPLCI